MLRSVLRMNAMSSRITSSAQSIVVRLGALLIAMCSIRSAAQSLNVVTIGGERGLGAEFGEIRDVALLPGHIVVLDRNATHLRVFDLTGRLLQTTGPRGAGPGEFRFPSSVAFDAAKNLVYVVDPANSRVVEYGVEGDTLRLLRSLTTNVANRRGICFMQNRMFGVSTSRTHLVDELTISDGRLLSVRVLGKPQSRHPLGQHQQVIYRASDGLVLCDEKTGLVWVSSRILGEIHRLTVSSGAHTMIAIDRFQPMRLEARDDRSIAMQTPENGYHNEIVSLFPDASNIRVVVGKRSNGSMTEFEVGPLSTSESLTVRAKATWREVGRIADVVVCIVNDPYPTLSLFKATGCP